MNAENDMKLFKYFLLLLIFTVTACTQNNTATKAIGIIVPLEHPAMNEIVAGFKEELAKNYHQPVQVVVKNAQHDANLLHSILMSMRDQNVDVVVPIATGTSQMALSLIKNQPVVALAAQVNDAERKKNSACNIGVVDDDLDDKQILRFVHTVYPNIHDITLVHSADDKVFPEIKEVIAEGKVLGITVHELMVQSLPELYSASQAIPQQTQAIFILKDSLIVSGINSLIKVAQARKIPLITSDDGSVSAGAAFALGVHEKQIGEEGAKLAIAALEGKNLCAMPIVKLKDLTVFANPKAIQAQGQSLSVITDAAKKFNYHVEEK